MTDSKLCLALDGLQFGHSMGLVRQFGSRCYAVKVHSLMDEYGPEVIDELKEAGAVRVWVDYKVHDTKDTVGLRVKSLVSSGADIVTVHASGSVSMMQAAVEAAQVWGDKNSPPEIWAITVLTSLDPIEIARIYGADRTPRQIVLEFARMAKEAGVTGVVCSAEEVGMLFQCTDLFGMKFIVPGTRSSGVALGNSQKRSGTPAQAIHDGATLLVAGSQVTKATDPSMAFDELATEIGMDCN